MFSGGVLVPQVERNLGLPLASLDKTESRRA